MLLDDPMRTAIFQGYNTRCDNLAPVSRSNLTEKLRQISGEMDVTAIN